MNYAQQQAPSQFIHGGVQASGFPAQGMAHPMGGGIGSLAPSRQGDLSRLGMRALMAATLATMMTATIAGALFG